MLIPYTTSSTPKPPFGPPPAVPLLYGAVYVHRLLSLSCLSICSCYNTVTNISKQA